MNNDIRDTCFQEVLKTGRNIRDVITGVTVAVCAKNEEDCISDCLKSIKAQTVKPIEIILVDDHSTDLTAQIARDLGVKVIKNEGQQLYDGRNTALNHCRTEVLAFIDADCIIDKRWVENIIRVLETYDVAGGTGCHPTRPSDPIVGWIYSNWLIIATESTGYTGGVVGGNCYFKTEALREVGGWISIPYSNAEDVYIAEKLKEAGYKLWFDDNIIAYHYVSSNLKGFIKKVSKAGEAITVMMRTAGLRNYFWWFTLSIPLVAVTTLMAIALLFFCKVCGLTLLLLIFAGSFIFTWRMFGSIRLSIPRFLARWIIIWPYGLGVVKGFFRKL